MTALACPRETALKVCGWATDPADARRLLDTLGLLAAEPAPAIPRPRTVLPPTLRHGSRSAYVSGCRCNRCTCANAVYMSRWRRRTIVTTRPRVVPVLVLTAPCGHGRHRAYPGQLALALEQDAA